MAGVGPPPKPAGLRARRNRVVGAAVVSADDAGKVEVPALPEKQTPWHAETLDYWREVWSSEFAGLYLGMDRPGLVAVFKLIDLVNYGQVEHMPEVRLQGARFGLSPLDRRRLNWEVGKKKTEVGPGPKAVAPPPHELDPRRALRAVK
jgi:hypothetical protein